MMSMAMVLVALVVVATEMEMVLAREMQMRNEEEAEVNPRVLLLCFSFRDFLSVNVDVLTKDYNFDLKFYLRMLSNSGMKSMVVVAGANSVQIIGLLSFDIRGSSVSHLHHEVCTIFQGISDRMNGKRMYILILIAYIQETHLDLWKVSFQEIQNIVLLGTVVSDNPANPKKKWVANDKLQFLSEGAAAKEHG
ncbi:hypothetical protein C5167_020188 [Papaver somniferum]|uniref:Uncharacterized protein n=1 Tax=Papaver somniferum TaxID=3469 RepID=A0A4Y7IVI0_PAPSO|nr:hypothetical protein C5167_020188 [Papaver somniferum]